MTQATYNFDRMTRLEMIDELTAVQNKKRTKLDREISELRQQARMLNKTLQSIEEKKMSINELEALIERLETFVNGQKPPSRFWHYNRLYRLPPKIAAAQDTIRTFLRDNL